MQKAESAPKKNSEAEDSTEEKTKGYVFINGCFQYSLSHWLLTTIRDSMPACILR